MDEIDELSSAREHYRHHVNRPKIKNANRERLTLMIMVLEITYDMAVGGYGR